MTAPGFGQDNHGTHGPLLEEAAKLAEALSKSWTDLSAGGFVHSLLSGFGESSECKACPVCQLLRVVGGHRPEVLEHLTDASASLIAALRASLESSQAAWTAGSRPTSERIDIS
jgi:hypothetical protein